MVIGVREAGPEPSILSLTALSLPVLHRQSAWARTGTALAVERGTAWGSSVLGQQGHPRFPAMLMREIQKNTRTFKNLPKIASQQKSQVCESTAHQAWVISATASCKICSDLEQKKLSPDTKQETEESPIR